MGSFTNPQRIINKEFDVYAQSAAATTNQVAKTVASMRADIAKQKLYTDKLQVTDDNKEFSLRTSLNEVGTTGNAILDENILAFWNEKVDDYFQIKNAMTDGTLSRQEGNRALAQIEGLVPSFKSMVNVLATNSATFKEDVANGNVSSVGSIENKSILNRIGQGGNVGIVERNGRIYFFAPEEGGEPEALINGSELIAQSNGGVPMYQTKPDLSASNTEIFNAVIKPEDVTSKYVEPIIIEKGSSNPITGEKMNNLEAGYKYTYRTITKDNRDIAIKDLVNSPAVSTMVGNDGLMARVWQDEIADGEFNEETQMWEPPNSIGAISQRLNLDPEMFKDGWHQYAEDMTEEERQALDNNQNAVMREYLGNKIYNDNSVMDNTMKFVKKEPYNPNADDEQTGEPYYNKTVENAYDFFQNPVDNANILVNSTINGQIVSGVRINDEGLIELYHTDASVDQGTSGDVKDMETTIAKFRKDDPISQAKLARLMQEGIGGKNKDNYEASNKAEELYPVYAEKMRLEKLEAKETQKGNGGFDNFLHEKDYFKWKKTNIGELTKEEQAEINKGDQGKYGRAAMFLLKYRTPEIQEKEGFTKALLNKAEMDVMKMILEERKLTGSLK
jgi:hypothetical protein